jgi:integrase
MQSEVPNYLFPNTKGQPFSHKTFLDALNYMAYDKNIRNAAGEIWQFQARQFRYTFAVRMFNHDIPLDVVHYLLGHKSKEVTMAYHYTQLQKLEAEMLRIRAKYHRQQNG